MEVTNVHDHVTHAVLGGMEAEACGISDEAEFFHILSSTLYSRKMEAVTREVLCNGWDSHIDSGITNIPLQITLTEQKLIIRDFGEGIHRSMIKPIYGTYGRSTKKKNKFVTGGFGLGSKAPWAYVDHFQVTSFHEGEQTIYNMSKSSAQVNGKPMITPIVTIPTQESGLEVSINLKQPSDMHKFRLLITKLAALGEMNVHLNGEQMPTVPFYAAKDGYLIMKRALLDHLSHANLYVRYGNVVYPIDSHENLTDEMRHIENDMNLVNSADQGWAMCLLAQPDTISVTPSRESLSMTDFTVSTLKQLMARVIAKTKSRIQAKCFELNKELVSKIPLTGKPVDLLTNDSVVLNKNKLPRGELSAFITNPEEFASRYMERTYPSFPGFKQQDRKLRLEALRESGFGVRGLTQTYIAESQKSQPSDSWLQQRLLMPMIRRLQTAHIDSSKFFVVDDVTSKRSWQSMIGFMHPLEYKPRYKNFDAQIDFLRPFVSIGFSQSDMRERISVFPALKNWFGRPQKSLAYIFNRYAKPEIITHVIEFFESQGYYVLDMTKRQKWESLPEPMVIKPRKAPSPKKPKDLGYPLMRSMINATSKSGMSTLKVYDVTNTDRKPFAEAVFSIGTRETVTELGNITVREIRAILNVWGDKIIMVPTSLHLDAVCKSHPEMERNLSDYILKQLAHEVTTNPLIEQYFRNTISPFAGDRVHPDNPRIIKMFLKDSWLRKKLGLPEKLKQREQSIILLIKNLARFELNSVTFMDAAPLLRKWTASSAMQSLIDQVYKQKLLQAFDTDAVDDIFSNFPPIGIGADQQQALRKFLLSALQGK